MLVPKRFLGILAAAWLLPASASAASILFGADFGSNTSSSLYSVNSGNGAVSRLFDTGGSIFDLASDSSPASFRLFGADNTQNALDLIDPAAQTVSTVAIDGLNGAIGSIAFDPVTRVLYATTIGGTGPDVTDTLYTISLTLNAVGDYDATTVGATGVRNILALTFTNAGALLGISDTTHNLVSIDTMAGTATTVAPVALRQVFALATNPDDGTILAGSSQTHALYTLDTTTGGTTLVGGYGSLANIDGLAFQATVPEPATIALLAAGCAALGLARRRPDPTVLCRRIRRTRPASFPPVAAAR